MARPILTSTSLDDVKALRYFGAKHPPFEQVASTYLFSLSPPGTKDRVLPLSTQTPIVELGKGGTPGPWAHLHSLGRQAMSAFSG